MRAEVPTLERCVCIGNDVALVAEISSLFRARRTYFPVFPAPRLTRDDWTNEVIRLNNAVARVSPEQIIYAGLGPEVKAALAPYFPQSKIIEIASSDDITQRFPHLLAGRAGSTHCGPHNIASALLKAKRANKRLHPLATSQEQGDRDVLDSPTGHILVCEARSDVVQVIAANYAYAIGASLLFIEEPSPSAVDEINEALYSVYGNDSLLPMPTQVQALKARIRTLLPDLNTQMGSAITFITGGVPYGLAVSDMPTAHLIAYPDLGISLVSSIYAEHQFAGVRVAVLIEPGDMAASEIDFIAQVLARRHAFIRLLVGNTARVYDARRSIEVYPYDLLVISCHASEVEGWRHTYQFTDSEGIDRSLVVEVAAGFGLKPGTDMFHVTEHMRFISLDGVPWDDEEKKKQLYVGRAIRDFIDMREQLRPTQIRDVKRVRGAMALGMSDGNLFLGLHTVADGNSPIILCNACGSWHQLAKMLIFGGARAYVGTLFDVTSAEACVFAERLFGRHIDEPLAFAVWQAQREVYDADRRPYLVVGPHFTHFRDCKTHAVRYLARRLAFGLRRWEQKRAATTDPELVQNIDERMGWVKEELSVLVRQYKSWL